MVTNAPDSVILICTATIAASEVIGERNNVNITDSPDQTTTTRFEVPQGQNWGFDDIYISVAADAGTSDPVIEVRKNGGKIMGQTPPLSNLLVSNNSRPSYARKKYFYRAGSTISMQTLNTIANDLTADTVRFIVRVTVF